VYAEEFFNLMFVVMLWLAFHLGIVIKRQFAQYQSSVFPRYRLYHLAGMVCVYLIVIGLSVLWGQGMILDLPWLPHQSMAGVWGSCLLASLIVIGVGYFSTGRVVLYGYCLLLVLSAFGAQITDIYREFPFLVFVPFCFWAAGLVFFLWRLSHLNEESFEYPYLLSWPPQASSGWQGRPAGAKDPCFEKAVRPCSGRKYFECATVWCRIRHWKNSDGEGPKLIWSMAWAVLAIYVLTFFEVSWMSDWLKNVYGNFLIFVVTPLVLVTVSYYKRLIFWGYDVVRPVSRSRYMKDHIVSVCLEAFWYWVLTVLVLGVVPSLVFYVDALAWPQFWGFFVLSGSLLFLTLAVVVSMVASESTVSFIVNAGLLSGIVAVLFGVSAEMTVQSYILCCWACLASGLIFIKRGYHAWCEKEYV
ncbi:MAG TPA: hypothetical protein P5160_03650, partial [Candidatus Omnitrophota bacterium]|nr:hypothetical protein [Candidatus Omnitrophota bacterium]